MRVARRSRFVTTALLGVAVLLALASCSRLTSSVAPSSSDPPTSPLRASPATTTAATGSRALTLSKAIDGSKGGDVRVGRWWVFVPPGAYKGVGTITVSVPDTTLAQCDLSISPESLNKFTVPVALRYMCVSQAEAALRDIEWWNPVTGTWVVIPSWTNPITYARWSSLYHFSTYRSGKAGW